MPTIPEPDRAGRLATRILAAPLTILVVAVGLGQWACWAPQYLTWPWSADHDVFGTMARSWDAGFLPYRDVSGNNFPGTIYAHWIVGKLAGWGRTSPFYALDAALVLGFGGALVVWSRRKFGAALPGAIGFVSFLGFYLALDYTQAAQRDFHGPLLAVMGLLAAQAWPDRVGRLLAALAFAACFVTRPQPILLLPALLSALDEPRREGEGITKTLGRAAIWGLATAAILALAFAPLALAGVLGDFWRGVRLTRYGGGYNTVGVGSFAKQFVDQVAPLKILAVPAAIALLAGGTPTPTRRAARTWILAFLGILLYRPLSPQPHVYLTIPLMLVWSVEVAVLAQVILSRPGWPATARLAALLVLLGLEGSLRPRFSNPKVSLDALPLLARGEMPATPPAGYLSNPGVDMSAMYRWDDYRATLTYLRTKLPPSTRLINALVGSAPLTGPTGRLSALPTEAIAWVRIVRPEAEPDFARAIEAADDAAVVWSPAEESTYPDEPVARLAPIIRRNYRPEARFGAIEVWRRATGPG